MIRNTTVRSSRKGGVLVATLVMVLGVGALSVCLLELDSTRLKRQVASIDNKCAFNLAEAGLSEAVFGLASGMSGNVGTQASPAKFGDGLFWVTSTEVQPSVFGLESTGMSGSGRVTLSLVVRRTPKNFASLGLMSSQDVTIGKRCVVDAFDSDGSTGIPIIDPLTAPPAPLRSNANISIGASSVVRGDATPGPLGSVTLGLGSVVTGSMASASDTADLPPIEVPEIAYGDDVVHTDSKPLVLNAPEAAHGVLHVGTGATVVLAGPSTVVVDQVIVESGGTLQVDSTAGAVELYVTDWLNLPAGSAMSFPQQDTKGFTLLVTATGSRDRDGDGVTDPAVRFLGTGPFFGTAYLPGARLALPADYQLYGSAGANKLVLNDGAQVHFDVALQELDGESANSIDAVSWKIVEIPVGVARDLSEDPFDALAVDPALLEKPADAHEVSDYTLYIKYVDLSDTLRTYRGLESAFDWSQVKAVSLLSRTTI